MADWDASQYLKFEDERSRPAQDLLARVPLKAARAVYDLGCGPGNSTALLARRFPGAAIVGVDSSPDMLRQARARLPECRFVEADLARWTAPGDADLLFSNATFQWVPDHLAVLRRLLTGLKEGGVLAVQMPDNLGEPSHTLMHKTAQSGPFAKTIGDLRRADLPAVADYYDALKPLCSRLDLWHVVYQHPLDGAQAIVEWLKGSGLRPYIEPLSAPDREDYLQAYTAHIAEAYPPRFDGKVLLRFPRLFIVALR